MIVLLISACTLGTVYADQPYRGQTRHKRSLRDANIRNAEDEYTDIDGETKDSDKNTVSISFTSDMEQDMEQYARVATYFKAESSTPETIHQPAYYSQCSRRSIQASTPWEQQDTISSASAFLK